MTTQEFVVFMFGVMIPMTAAVGLILALTTLIAPAQSTCFYVGPPTAGHGVTIQEGLR